MNETAPAHVLTPLFPLHTVLFPGSLLPLRIFEARYLDMISASLRHGTAFGIVPIRQGSEVGATPDFFPFGTLATVETFGRGADGLLQVRILGSSRFRVGSHALGTDLLLSAAIEPLAAADDAPIPHDLTHLRALLREIFAQHAGELPYRDHQFDSALWVAYRLAEVLPLGAADKLTVLQADTGLVALARLDASIGALTRPPPRSARH